MNIQQATALANAKSFWLKKRARIALRLRVAGATYRNERDEEVRLDASDCPRRRLVRRRRGRQRGSVHLKT